NSSVFVQAVYMKITRLHRQQTKNARRVVRQGRSTCSTRPSSHLPQQRQSGPPRYQQRKPPPGVAGGIAGTIRGTGTIAGTGIMPGIGTMLGTTIGVAADTPG